MVPCPAPRVAAQDLHRASGAARAFAQDLPCSAVADERQGGGDDAEDRQQNGHGDVVADALQGAVRDEPARVVRVSADGDALPGLRLVGRVGPASARAMRMSGGDGRDGPAPGFDVEAQVEAATMAPTAPGLRADNGGRQRLPRAARADVGDNGGKLRRGDDAERHDPEQDPGARSPKVFFLKAPGLLQQRGPEQARAYQEVDEAGQVGAGGWPLARRLSGRGHAVHASAAAGRAALVQPWHRAATWGDGSGTASRAARQ